jgi:hypothetical protein
MLPFVYLIKLCKMYYLIIFVIVFTRSPVAGRLAAVDLLLSPRDKLDPGPALIDCPRISIKAATLLIILHTTT